MLVKKYSNRRLYDTEASRYITLEELADKVRAGSDVMVVDAKTNSDLTQATLTQIILENRAHLLPVPLLTKLVRMQDDSLAEFFGRYMSWALELYLQAKQGAQAVSPYLPVANVPFQATNALARLLLGAASPWMDQQPAPPPGAVAASAPVPPPPPPVRDNESEMHELRRELDELKRSLKRPRRAKS